MRWVTTWLRQNNPPFAVDWVIEEIPLGTGGGMLLAVQKAMSDHVFILNGDTMFEVPLREMSTFAQRQKAECTLALKHLQHFDRYGAVSTGAGYNILSFEEKKPVADGDINGGIYLLDRALFLQRNLPVKFSFEQDYLGHFVSEGAFFGYRSAGYFIDIGIPEDYERAGVDFKTLFPE